ncbi:unnamed protein product [Amoebophrya sp. A25]|nr:unnamed protein product [Amoebophrya sp. A25]|eukprot:GSA25T00019207001.1
MGMPVAPSWLTALVRTHRIEVLTAIVIGLLLIWFFFASDSDKGDEAGSRGKRSKKERLVFSFSFDTLCEGSAEDSSSVFKAFLQEFVKFYEHGMRQRKDVEFDVYAIHRLEEVVASPPAANGTAPPGAAASSSSATGRSTPSSSHQQEGLVTQSSAALAKLHPSIPSHKRELFCSTTAGRVSMVRQLRSHVHFDCNKSVVDALQGKIAQAVLLEAPRIDASSTTVDGDHDYLMKRVADAVDRAVLRLLDPQAAAEMESREATESANSSSGGGVS